MGEWKWCRLGFNGGNKEEEEVGMGKGCESGLEILFFFSVIFFS